MQRIALTGGIATGKSYVLDRFRARGVPVVDADLLAHRAMAAGTEVTAAIADRFGTGAIASDGSVDRRALAPIVFADPAARRDLERIVHPAVYRAIVAALRELELAATAPFAVVDVPLLYESGHASAFDRVIVTASPADVQLERLVRRGLTPAEARQRLAAQLPTVEKASRADFVVRTDGSLDDTDRQVDEILRELGAGSRRSG